MTPTALKRFTVSNLPVPFRQLDDAALTELLLGHQDEAWREFMRRFDPPLRRLVARSMTRALRTVLDSDAIDDAMGDFHLAVVEDNMRKLRAWYYGPRQKTLLRFLGLIARGIAIDHIRHAHRNPTERIVEQDENEGDAACGERFNRAEKRAAEPRLRIADPERKRVFVWFGDEWLLVYDEEGQEIDRHLVGANWTRKVWSNDVERVINRLIKRAEAKTKKRKR